MDTRIFSFLISVFTFGFIAPACSQNNSQRLTQDETSIHQQMHRTVFSLADFFAESKELDSRVEEAFQKLSEKQKIAQVIMPAMGKHGQPKNIIDGLVQDELIGGILMLNGTVEEYSEWISQYNEMNTKKGVPGFLYSADAEPSLVNRKVVGTRPVAKANTLQNIEEVKMVAQTISEDLLKIGINYNFAPVVDMAPNKTVGWRSFGHYPDSVIAWSAKFIEASQDLQVMATAKHFPGHGYVVGDTHEKLVFIDGEMREVKNYPPLIDAGVMSIMIAHIAVKNNEKYNTNGMPATTSKKIVTDLLREEMGYQGLIVTDALNMGGVKNVPNANVLALEAGCDILLMPLNARQAHAEITKAYQSDLDFKAKVDTAAKRILRAKICLGLI
jgi:beta-N-acetylhexosaminidase